MALAKTKAAQASKMIGLLRNHPERARRFIESLTEVEAAQLMYDWDFWAREKQRLPQGDFWQNWMLLAGRGFGKTRTGAETVRHFVEKGLAKRVALIGPSAADARDVMIEGESGILNVSPPWFRPEYSPSKRRITWPNGAIATIYSAEDPEQLRGPQHDFGWSLTPDTLVTLANNSVKPIIEVTVGEYVLTRKGPRKVLANYCTSPASQIIKLTTVEGELRGSPTHPVYVEGRAFIPLKDVREGDKILCLRKSATEAAHTLKSTTDTISGALGQESTVRKSPSTLDTCTEISIFTKSVLSKKVTSFITKITTQPTIALKTWSAFLRENIQGFTCWAIPLLTELKLLPAFALDTNRRLSNPESVSSVMRRLLIRSGEEIQIKNSAVHLVKTSLDGEFVPVTRIEHLNLLEPVYDLLIDEENEFFANNILVHNCDELAAWAYPETWDLYQFGLRLGKNPRTVITTTPKPIKIVKELVKDPRTVVTTGSSYENRDNLAPTFFTKIVTKYEGTRLGRQELHAEIINMEEEGIIKRSWFKLYPAKQPLPEFDYIVMSLDTAFEEENLPDGKKKKEPDPTACTVWGLWKPLDKSYQCLLLDAWDERLNYPDLRTRIVDEFKYTYGEKGKKHKPDACLIENKGSGISLRQDLNRAGLPCRPYNPGRDDKIARLHAVSHIPCHGRVHIPESPTLSNTFCTWAEPFVEQVCTIPNAENDDYGDTFSQFLAFVRDSGWINLDPAPPEDDREEWEKHRHHRNPYSTGPRAHVGGSV